MKSFSQLIKIIILLIIVVGGFSLVSAWTAPTNTGTGTVATPLNDTAGAVFAALNTSVFDQIKKGGLIIADPDERFVSPLSFFKKVALPGVDTAIAVGGVGASNPDFTTTFPGNREIPVFINLSDRRNTVDGANNDAIKFIPETAECPIPTILSTDSSAYQFWSRSNKDNADVLAGGIRLTGGNPAPGKILISVDDAGRAVWATPELAPNGIDIIFNTTDSPVGSCTPSEGGMDVCTNLPGTQTIIPDGYEDPLSTGQCTLIDLCLNIDEIQTIIPDGYESLIPGECTLTPVDPCPTLPEPTSCTGRFDTVSCSGFDGFTGICRTGANEGGNTGTPYCQFTAIGPQCASGYVWQNGLLGQCTLNDGSIPYLPPQASGQWIQYANQQCIDVATGQQVADSFCGPRPLTTWNLCTPPDTEPTVDGVAWQCIQGQNWSTIARGTTNVTCTQSTYMPNGIYTDGDVVCLPEGQTPDRDRCTFEVDPQDGPRFYAYVENNTGIYQGQGLSGCFPTSPQPNFCPPNNIVGCTNSFALNYNPQATTANNLTCTFNPSATFNTPFDWNVSYITNRCSVDYVAQDTVTITAEDGFNWLDTNGYTVEVEVFARTSNDQIFRETFNPRIDINGLTWRGATFMDYNTTTPQGGFSFTTTVPRNSLITLYPIVAYRYGFTFTNTTTGQTQTYYRHYNVGDYNAFLNCNAPVDNTTYIADMCQQMITNGVGIPFSASCQ